MDLQNRNEKYLCVSKLSKDFIDVNIKVDEGNRYYIRDINWVGNFKYTDAELTEKLGIKKVIFCLLDDLSGEIRMLQFIQIIV